MRYRLADFDYALPPELIAQTPARERRASRLLRVEPRRASAPRLTDLTFAGLPELLAPGDLLVLNDTRVIRARVHGRKPTGGEVEMLVERVTGDDTAIAQLRASHLPRAGGIVLLPGNARAVVTQRHERFFELRFEGAGSLHRWLELHGEVPLPPYIAHAPDAADAERYQTVYARAPGAVAAPTAGLHFDAAMLDALAAKGVVIRYVTLHVGAGTFQPVTSDDLAHHRMHAEVYDIPQATVEAIAATRSRGARVLAVGTTTLRALEAAADPAGLIRSGPGETALFITPGYAFRVVDRLLTNFHLPRSTLLMLVSAFAGHDAIRAAYAHAIAQRYRFMSYGDATLLEGCEPVPAA
ncbi:MAG: tRNA preQ1(34) S-adenosylmethionine ribosyltransferase-isomerase QueA [Proteobacteria bacterium]|jgi:S-adenosylmethionine:tRNA ribosyltransferase-isomerase|nr:tRNA preQ1(34) S-adenosylmethionine ribosyltransferase-isomerase QueA [Pseudomonadota bacterium]